MIWIPNQLIGAAIGNPDVTLECITEAMPKAIAYWVFNGTMVMTAGRYKTHEHHHSNYKLDLKLHIKNVQEEDYGMYKCLSKNSHGDNEGAIQLYKLDQEPSNTISEKSKGLWNCDKEPRGNSGTNLLLSSVLLSLVSAFQFLIDLNIKGWNGRLYVYCPQRGPT